MDIQLKNNRGQLVKLYRNYGFIRFEGRDVFVHHDGYLHGFKPEIDQLVSFDFALAPEPGRPPVAVNVRVTKPASAVRAEKQIADLLKARQNQTAGFDALSDSQAGASSDGEV